MVTTLGWIACWYGAWSLAMVLVIGANLSLLWPIISIVEPGGFPKDVLYPAIGAFLVALPGVVVPLFGPELLERGRRMRASDAITVLTEDRRAPVLYLRSFEDEDLLDPTLPSIFAFSPRGVRPPFVRNRYERTLTLVLNQLGPVICIGTPGEDYPEVGAGRVYVSEDVWQTAVKYCIARSSAVVLTVGRTRSLWWEINTALTLVPRERLLFFFPYAENREVRQSVWRKYYAFLLVGLVTARMLARMEADRQARYQLFREETRSTFQTSLPAVLGTSLFLTFSADGSPLLLESKRMLDKAIIWRFFKVSWTQVDLRRTLQPFLEKRRRPQ